MITLENLDNRPKIYTPALASALKELGVPNPSTAALFVNQLSFWMNTKAGHFTRDGEKFIYNTYQDWCEQFPCMSESQIGRMIRSLCSLGIIIKESFSDLKRRLKHKPSGFQEYNRTSWMSLCIEKLVQLGVDLGYNPESLLGANLQSCSLDSSVAQHPTCTPEFSTIYTKKTLSSPNVQTQEEKEIVSFPNTQNPLNSRSSPPGVLQVADFATVQQANSTESVSKQNFHEYQVNHEGNIPAASSDIPKKRINVDLENKSQEQRLEKYVWEIAVNEPYPVFLNWWADTHYKPQGGKWETGAYYYACISFYNHLEATLVLWKQFSRYIDITAKTCNQLQNDGQKAILPSCFVPLPEATEENKQTLMGNVKTLVEKGAAVLMPTKSTTPTSQSLPFAEAVGASTIKALPELKQLPDVHELRRQYYDLRGQTEAQVALLNELLSVGDDILTEEALKFARASKFNAEYNKDGAPVKIYDARALTESKPEVVSNIDWDALAQKCQDIWDEDYYEN